jgi:hypothetical protein
VSFPLLFLLVFSFFFFSLFFLFPASGVKDRAEFVQSQELIGRGHLRYMDAEKE